MLRRLPGLFGHLGIAGTPDADIEREHPFALDRFAAAMYSGDRVLINDTALVTIDLLQGVLPVVPSDGGDDGIFIARTVDKLHVVLVVHCVILFCGVVVDLQTPFWHADTFAGTPDVKFEQWVDKVASTLA